MAENKADRSTLRNDDRNPSTKGDIQGRKAQLHCGIESRHTQPSQRRNIGHADRSRPLHSGIKGKQKPFYTGAYRADRSRFIAELRKDIISPHNGCI
jgi:IS30 family transposase